MILITSKYKLSSLCLKNQALRDRLSPLNPSFVAQLIFSCVNEIFIRLVFFAQKKTAWPRPKMNDDDDRSEGLGLSNSTRHTYKPYLYKVIQ